VIAAELDARVGDIIARAATPDERAAHRGFRPREGFDPSIAEQRLERWVDGVTAGDRPLFRQLLQLRGLDEATFVRGLADVTVADATDLPAWAGDLIRLVEDMEAFEAIGWRPELPELSDGVPLAFDALLPLVYSAAHELAAILDERGVAVSDRARLQMLRTFEGRLLSVTVHVLDDELQAHHAAARLTGGTVSAHDIDGTSGGWLRRFAMYPVLGRLVAVVFRNWINLMAELVERLAEDRELLSARLFSGAPLGELVGFGGDAGDLHEQGRSVAQLTFAGGRRVVYKPKDLRVSARFQDLLTDLEDSGFSPRLAVRTILPRGGYAWEEFVAHAPCETESDVRDYYVRMGALARVLQLLGARDFWFDNLIAAGSQPAFIDLETVIQQRPPTPSVGRLPVELIAFDRLEESAVNIGCLAHLTPIGEGTHAEDIGGLTPPRPFTTPFRFNHTPALSAVIHADLSEDGYVRFEKLDYSPMLNGDPVQASEHFDDLVTGYRRMHAHLIAGRERLLAADGPLTAMGDAPIRHIQRDTWSCMKIITNSLRSAMLVDGLRREAFLQSLIRGSLETQALDAGRLASLNSEIDAFRDLDIPLFQSLPATDSLMLRDGGILEGYFDDTAMSHITERLRTIETMNVDEQVDLIRANLSTGPHPPPPAAAPTSRAATGSAWLDEAIAIGDGILAQAIEGERGELAWLGVTLHPHLGLRAVEVLRPDVLTGTSGLAILFADLFAATGLPRFRRAAAGALASTRQIVADAPRLFAALARNPGRTDRLFCGRWYGMGSQVYALQRVGGGLCDPELSALADAHARALPPDVLAERSSIDMVSGLAGLVSVVGDPGPLAAHLVSILDRHGGLGPSIHPAGIAQLKALPTEAGGIVLALRRAAPRVPGDLRARIGGWVERLSAEEAAAGGSEYQRLLFGLAGEGHDATAVCEFLGADVRAQTSRRLLDLIEVGLDAEELGAAAGAAEELLQRRRDAGSWFPESHATDRHDLSIVSGVAAIAHAFLRLGRPGLVRSIRLPA
jgi:type 2 lantibiotic biosynthesis protein LanM